MQDFIKKICSYMNMNQTEFAEQLNVIFATVNRWENGCALPNKLAQDKIYDLCREHNVPVYQSAKNCGFNNWIYEVVK